MNVALILIGTGATLAGCWSAGVLLFRSLRIAPLHGSVVFGAGAAALSTLVFALAACQLLYVPMLVAVLALLTGLSLRLRRPGMGVLSPWLLAFVPFFIWYFVYALAPEVSADGAYYHLTYPRQYLEHHGFFPIVYNMYASLPQGLEMLFVPAIALSSSFSSAALLHLAFLVTLASAIVHYGERKPWSWLAALLVFASPVAGFDASIAYNDGALAACTFLVFVACGNIRSEQPGYAIVAGVLAGFCFAIKYTGALAIPFVVVAAAMRTRTAKGPLLALAASLVIAGPWLIKNWMVVDNPVSPFFNRAFPNAHVRVELEDQYRIAMQHFGGHVPGPSTPLELTLRGGSLQGVVGPVFLLAPFASLGSWRLALIGMLFALPWTQNIGTRFLIPALPFFACGIAMFVARAATPWTIYATAGIHMVLSWPPVLALYCAPWCWRIEEFPWRAALRLEPEQAFLRRRIPETFDIVQLINARTANDGRVYTALPLPDAYCDRVVLLDYTSALANAIRDGFKSSDPVRTRAAMQGAGVRYLLIHRDEPHAKGMDSDPESWGIKRIGESGPGRLYKVR